MANSTANLSCARCDVVQAVDLAERDKSGWKSCVFLKDGTLHLCPECADDLRDWVGKDLL